MSAKTTILMIREKRISLSYNKCKLSLYFPMLFCTWNTNINDSFWYLDFFLGIISWEGPTFLGWGRVPHGDICFDGDQKNSWNGGRGKGQPPPSHYGKPCPLVHPCLKLIGGTIVDRTFHPFKINMSIRNYWKHGG